MRSTANRVGGAVIVASLLIASALLARVHDLLWMAFAGFCLAFVLGLYLLWKNPTPRASCRSALSSRDTL